jgi:hypothetical protein
VHEVIGAMNVPGGSQPTAFISWAHADDLWQKAILELAFSLRRNGIDADVDLFHTEAGIDWSAYGPRAIEECDYVLIATSSAYKARWQGGRPSRAGAGAAREANVLKNLFDSREGNFFDKVMIVVLPGVNEDEIPPELGSALPRFVIPRFELPHLKPLLSV